MYLIEKNGFYYRPDASGYTGRKSEAGRYTFSEAALHAGPNGPDGSQDGISIWKEDEAPEHSPSCSREIRMQDAAYKRGWDDAMKSMSADTAEQSQK